jgi:hypothetical protein
MFGVKFYALFGEFLIFVGPIEPRGQKIMRFANNVGNAGPHVCQTFLNDVYFFNGSRIVDSSAMAPILTLTSFRCTGNFLLWRSIWANMLDCSDIFEPNKRIFYYFVNLK